ncbi:hypothetical protein E4U39_000830 [Claviceps sp. Clav50 group G5]|nr:hypothetical protein E4U39_000830 [Claviceps sp. Clav50 group G5]
MESREVTDQAKEEWDNSKASCSEKQVDRDIQHGGDSQPPRPPNWRRLQRTQTLGASDAIRSRQDRRRQRDGSEFDDDESERLCKVDKVARSPTISQGPDSSVASLSCADSVVHSTSEIDSPGDLDQGDLNPAGNQRLMIQLPKKPLFDPAEYSSQHNTQASGLSSQSIAELESQDDCLFVASQLSRQTIPDSQEPSGQTWSVDLQSSAHSARETWISSQVDHRHYPTVKLQQNELHPGTSRSSCLLEARTHSIGHSSASELSNGPDIPSHQPHQPKSLSGTTQDFHLTAFADELNFEASTPGIGSELSIVPDSNAAPAFLSQPPLPFCFPIPESSSSVLQGSPDASVVDESISNLGQVSASASSAADNLTESQDAQILPITPFVSHVSAFTVSHDTEQGGNPLVTPQQASTELSQPSTSVSVVTHDRMDSSRAARTPSKPAWLSSAVDELSQIFALDDDSDDIAEDPDSPDFKTALAEAVANSRKAESFGPDVQASQARQQQSQPYSLVAKSEQAKFKSPPKSPPSAVQSLQGMVDMIFRRPDLPVSDPILPDATQHEGPSTVSLADISNSQKLTSSLLTQEELSSVGLPRSEYHSSAAAASVHMSSLEPDDESDDESDDDDDDDDDSDSSSSQEAIALKHTVTIPFQASIRPLYDDTLLEYKKEIQQYGNVFSSEEYIEPDEALVRKIDQVLDGLRNLCDYPPDVIGSAIETLPSNQLIKYCCDGNGKFNFLFELLQGLTKDTRILIVARSVELLKLLYRLAEALGIECICGDLGSSFKPETGISISRITLILPERDVDEDDFDLVIGYDYSFGSSVVGLRLEPEIPGARSPMVLTLVTTHSIEHIDLHVPGDLTLLERKNALVSGIVRARQLVKDPDRGCPEPYEVASLFVEYLNGLAEDVIWEPIPLPEDILDIYLHSQSRSQIPATDAPEVLDIVRKRKLDDQDDSDNDGAKRPRISFSKQPTVGADNAPVPDDVRALLDSVKPKSMDSTAATPLTGVVSVPVAVLQALAEQVSELRRQGDTADTNTPYKNLISALDARIKEYERTSAKIYSSHRAALEDRATFERQAHKAEAALQTTKDATQKLTEKSQKKIADLEATVTRLTAGPDASKETPLSKTQKLLQEAQEKAQTLEKRLEIALKDADYARSLYQDVTATSGALRGENASLKAQVTDLARKTEDTLGKVHAIQADTAIKHHLVQISDLKSQLRERDLELEHTKDELRLLKRARRETRQVSVPRSPRLGMMSPRTGRVSHGGAGEGASASRGGSPANARWKNHLRD